MRTILLLCLGLAIFGCESTRRAKLEENVRTYFLALRRADQGAILSYVHPNQQQSFYENSQKLDGLHISNVQIEAIFPDESLETALVSAQVEYFSQGGSLLSSAKRQFAWKYSPEAKTWLLEETEPLGSQLVKK